MPASNCEMEQSWGEFIPLSLQDAETVVVPFLLPHKRDEPDDLAGRGAARNPDLGHSYCCPGLKLGSGDARLAVGSCSSAMVEQRQIIPANSHLFLSSRATLLVGLFPNLDLQLLLHSVSPFQ